MAKIPLAELTRVAGRRRSKLSILYIPQVANTSFPRKRNTCLPRRRPFAPDGLFSPRLDLARFPVIQPSSARGCGVQPLRHLPTVALLFPQVHTIPVPICPLEKAGSFPRSDKGSRYEGVVGTNPDHKEKEDG